ncbi:hypothetical protein IQ268_26120 [Oculatella sp. LEGE 06141]|uniref:TnsD family Tn7-like transposition protein n=1 Tax=Oculatella sp. LEGE 06141 TaxID=1828648 RepID=UPI001881892A|nr:TnsD family Tn7-like transposition protein [Oculatella sp. LEGE 06141]MBE9182049.1 hypothetical protein [Oculatella sp. LEGE 06141]
MRSYYQLDKVCSAEQAIRITQVRPIDQSKFSHQIFLKIAQNVNWLLNQHDVELTSELVQRRYQSLLFNKGLTTYLGKLRVKKLLEAIQDYYPGQLLKSLQCEIGESTHSNWVLRTLRPSSAFQNPLYHLLIIFFLGYNISDFLQVSAEIKPFGNSPWPCLNPACQHFLKRVIQKCQVVQNTYGNAKGIFCCNCGFTYSRVGPDRSEEDRFRFISVEEYGRVWDSSLQKMWRNSEITLKEMADFLKVDSQTIKRQATRLELDFPRQSKGVEVLELSTSIKSSKVFSPPSAQEYRSEWLTIRELNPDLGRTALLQQFGRVYSWLYKHDKEWLNEHLPTVRKRDFSSSSNWNEKDAALKISIEEAAKRLKDSIGRPIRVTARAISIEVGNTRLRQNIQRLPLANQALVSSVESREDFFIRRVYWASDCFRQEGIHPTYRQIACRAGIRPHTETLESVQKAITVALQSFTPQNI